MLVEISKKSVSHRIISSKNWLKIVWLKWLEGNVLGFQELKVSCPRELHFLRPSVVGSLWNDSHWALPPDTHSAVWPPPLHSLLLIIHYGNIEGYHLPWFSHLCLISQLSIAFLVCVYFYEISCHNWKAHLAGTEGGPGHISNEEKKLSFQKSLRTIMPQPLRWTWKQISSWNFGWDCIQIKVSWHLDFGHEAEDPGMSGFLTHRYHETINMCCAWLAKYCGELLLSNINRERKWGSSEKFRALNVFTAVTTVA